jgi:hypothetical protein
LHVAVHALLNRALFVARGACGGVPGWSQDRQLIDVQGRVRPCKNASTATTSAQST